MSLAAICRRWLRLRWSVISARNPVYSVLFLILAFFNAAALFVLIGAEFIAMILVIVYVGAVAVLFLFVVMMLDINLEQLREGFLRYLPIGAAIGAVLLAEILFGSTVSFGGGYRARCARCRPGCQSGPTNTRGAGPVALHALSLSVPGRGKNLVAAGRDDRHAIDADPAPTVRASAAR